MKARKLIVLTFFAIVLLSTCACGGREEEANTSGPGIAPSAPQLLSPEPGVTGVPLRPTFTWTAVAGMTAYDFQLATDAEFTNRVIDVTLGDQQTYQPTQNLSPVTQYFWRVRAHDGTTTPWSTAGFTTEWLLRSGCAFMK